MRVNMDQIARECGVAMSTVSLAIRGSSKVAPETREAVMKAARRLGYKKRQPGRPRKKKGDAVSPRRTLRVALLVPHLSLSTLYAPVYSRLLHGVEREVTSRGYTMVLRHVPDSAPREIQLLPTTVDGVIVFGVLSRPEWRDQLKSTPVVQVMWSHQPDDAWDRVTYDNRSLGRIAAEFALRRGHRVAAYLGHDAPDIHKFLRQRGIDFATEFENAGGRAYVHFETMAFNPDMHYIPLSAMQHPIESLWHHKPRPTLIFTEADMVTQTLYPALTARGIVPGRDVEVLSCNNEIPLIAPLQPRPHTIDIHADDVGRAGVERLFWRMQHPDAPPGEILIRPTLVEGDPQRIRRR